MFTVPTSKSELATSNDKFTQKLYSKIVQSSSKESNLIFAPFSLNTVLTMALLGARGETKEEMRSALALPANDTDIIQGKIIIGYHLSVTKLNGLSPNFLFKYNQHKSFFHHQIKLFITKFNTFLPNKLIFESPNILTSHQNSYKRQSQSLLNCTYFKVNFVTKTNNLFQVSSFFINLLFIKVKSQYNHSKNYWWFSKWFWWLENENNFGDFIQEFWWCIIEIWWWTNKFGDE